MNYKQQIVKYKNLIIAFTFLVLATLLNLMTDKKVDTKPAPMDAATYIPKGYVLVPIEFTNFETLNALVKDFAIIDLYTTPNTEGRNTKIAERIKVIRAPYNPNLFAVLVKSDLSEVIMRHAGPFWGTLQNTQTPEGQNIIRPMNTKKIHIDINSNGDNT